MTLHPFFLRVLLGVSLGVFLGWPGGPFVGCGAFASGDTEDGGSVDDAGADGGVDAGADAGVDAGADGGVDAGADAGVDAGADAGGDGGCAGCGDCTPGETRCVGVRISRCDAAGVFSPDAVCADGLCRGRACVPVSACEAQVPACCALPSDCGPLQWRFTCAECRPVDADADCLSGVCAGRVTELVNITLRASARDLLPADRVAVKSGVFTIYRGASADGRVVDCAMLLAGAHDQRDLRLNVVHSGYLDYQAGTGNDLFDARIRGLPREPDQALLLTVYGGYQGRGRQVARACVAPVNLSDGDLLIVDLVALP